MSQFHLIPDGDAWKLTTEAGEKVFAGVPTKDEALDAAIKTISGQGGSLKIYNADGSIAEERTYPRADDPPEMPG